MLFSDFKGNYKQIKDLQTYLKNDFCSILVSGDHSSGKTSIHDMLVAEHKYDILFINSENYNENIINNFIKYRTINSFFTKSPEKKIIFFDDIDCININKTHIQTLIDLKKKTYFIFTVLSSEKKKLLTTYKKIIDHEIQLANISLKDCVQIIFSRVKALFDEDEIDFDKLVSIIKAQSCNINNIMMLIDDCKNETIVLSDELKDNFEHNIYLLTKKLISEPLSEKHINDIYLRDYGIVFSLVHENITEIITDIEALKTIYATITYCDILDKYNYVHCKWGINSDCLNYYRFKKLNTIINNVQHSNINIKFTQQFTKLSSQSSIKKKIMNIDETYFPCILDYLQFQTKSSDVKNFDKNEKDLMVRFKKDF